MLTIMRGERSEHPGPPFSFPDFVDIRDHATTFSGMLGYHDDFMYITGSGKPERIYGAATSASYFEVLGVRPILGVSLISNLQNESAGKAEAVLGYDLWQTRFAGDPAIIGKTIEINLHPYTVVGVAPPGFQGCKSGLRTDIWMPIGMERQIWGSNRLQRRDAAWLNVLGVLRPGVDHRQAENELNLLMQRIVDRYPTEHLSLIHIYYKCVKSTGILLTCLSLSKACRSRWRNPQHSWNWAHWLEIRCLRRPFRPASSRSPCGTP